MEKSFKLFVFAFALSRLLSSFSQDIPHVSPDASSHLYDCVIKSIVLIECGDSSGSGFVARMRNVNYLFTNKHVIRSGNPVVAKLLDGQKLSLGTCQIADGVDLARFIVKPLFQPLPSLLPSLRSDRTFLFMVIATALVLLLKSRARFLVFLVRLLKPTLPSFRETAVVLSWPTMAQLLA